MGGSLKQTCPALEAWSLSGNSPKASETICLICAAVTVAYPQASCSGGRMLTIISSVARVAGKARQALLWAENYKEKGICGARTPCCISFAESACFCRISFCVFWHPAETLHNITLHIIPGSPFWDEFKQSSSFSNSNSSGGRRSNMSLWKRGGRRHQLPEASGTWPSNSGSTHVYALLKESHTPLEDKILHGQAHLYFAWKPKTHSKAASCSGRALLNISSPSRWSNHTCCRASHFL